MNENQVKFLQSNKRTDDEMVKISADFYHEMQARRSVRMFSKKPVARQVIENCIRTAATAPSGANLQPWFFVAVESLDIKKKIRAVCEAGEREFYHGKAPEAWFDALAKLGTNENKQFLEDAPYLIVVFLEKYRPGSDGQTEKNYYMSESVGIATGLLITALHHAGLVCLTYTPSGGGTNVEFNGILGRPDNERPFMIVVAGHPADACTVPAIKRKPSRAVMRFA